MYELIEAKKILAEKRKLLQKHPNRFSLQVTVRQWNNKVAAMEQKDIFNKAIVEAMTDEELETIGRMINDEMNLRTQECEANG